MKMKSVIGVLAALVLVFGLSAGATAATLGACEECKGCDLGAIDCEPQTFQEGDDECRTFNYHNGRGYCSFPCRDSCRLMFKICDCEETEVFVDGATIGLEICALTEGLYINNNQVGCARIFDQNIDDVEDACKSSDWDEACWGDIRAYEECDIDSDEVDLSDCDEGCGTYDCDDMCRIKMLSQCEEIGDDEEDGLVIGEDIGGDVGDEWGVVWEVFLPCFWVDPNEVTPGEIAQASVRLIMAAEGVCGDCEVVCECIVDLGIICCPATVTIPEGGCFYFPYVIAGTQSGWFTGFVVTALENPLTGEIKADRTIELTLTMEDGSVYTATVDMDAAGVVVWAVNLNTIAWNEGTPSGSGTLRVETDFVSDGYEYLSNGSFGLGTLPRCCLWELMPHNYDAIVQGLTEDFLGMSMSFADVMAMIGVGSD
jgi:hypothetical protein